MTDFRYAVRLLLRTPGHTATAVLALALGLGATVAIFSAVYTTLYRPLPIPDADRLVIPVGENAERGITRASIPLADVADWRAEKGLFERVAVYRGVAGTSRARAHRSASKAFR
jgi:putative ABC transport system permease protein